MDIYIKTDSLCYTPETNTTLLSQLYSNKNKKEKKTLVKVIEEDTNKWKDIPQKSMNSMQFLSKFQNSNKQF